MALQFPSLISIPTAMNEFGSYASCSSEIQILYSIAWQMGKIIIINASKLIEKYLKFLIIFVLIMGHPPFGFIKLKIHAIIDFER